MSGYILHNKLMLFGVLCFQLPFGINFTDRTRTFSIMYDDFYHFISCFIVVLLGELLG